MRFIKSTFEYKEIQNSFLKKSYSNSFIFLFKKNIEEEFAFGITVSKKVGNAVTRNLIRRRLKAYFRYINFLKEPALRVVIIAKKKCAYLNWTDMNKEINKFFKQLSKDEIF